MIYFALVFTLLFFLTISAGSAQQTVFVSIIKDGSAENSVSVQGYMPIVKSSLPPAQPPGVGPIWGVNFISSAEDRDDDQQYQNGIATGASWNRWPLYWFNIETNPNVYDWSKQDETVSNDIAHGLKIDAILLGTPPYYTTSALESADPDRPGELGQFEMREPESAAPMGLHDSIFTDGTDIPGPGKNINSNNVWARFTYEAVNRYRSGGVLAQTQNWPAGTGITHWEIWNEPDLAWFWDSSKADYARLLKVGYLAVKHADSSSVVLFGGLANNHLDRSYYDDVLTIFDSDPMANSYGYYHDILATHSYFNSWESWYHVYRATQTMAKHGFDKPVWLNESGVPAWDDYPGPNWDPFSAHRATMSEQMDYLVQNAFYATFAGADAIFHFQLYDGCGNQPAGTDFPPHGGELCGTIPICGGDAFGLFRNPTDAACYTQHPHPETPRPYLATFQMLTSRFRNVVPLWRQRPGGTEPSNGPQEWIAFTRPETNERIVGMWSRVREDQTAVIDAVGSSGLVVRPDGTSQVVYPSGGKYTLQLLGATNQNHDGDPSLVDIGGRPLILIETISN